MLILILYVGLTCGIFTRDGVEIPCPDSTAGLYIRTRNDQIVKVHILLLELQVTATLKYFLGLSFIQVDESFSPLLSNL